MATVATQIRIDNDIKAEAVELFRTLGMDMSSAVNMFLRQCLLRGGLPFAVELPHYSSRTLAAIEEARRISADPTVPAYDSLADLKKALDDDV